MGRIRTIRVKRTAKSLVERFSGNLGHSFEENKKKVTEMVELSSKKLRNQIAGVCN